MMTWVNRRTVVAALACGWGRPTVSSAAHAAAPTQEAVLAWSAAGCWVARRGEAFQALPDRLAAGIAPAPTALGVWLVNDHGALRCWAPAAGRAWQLRCTLALDSPVHALVAMPDGHWVAAAHGQALSLVDARGEIVKTLEGRDLNRTAQGAAAALFALPQRRSLVAAWPTLGELWEVSIDPDAPPIFDGLVHDYRMGEAIATPGYLGARRSPLGRPMPAFSFSDEQVPWLAGVQGRDVAVAHLDVRRRIATLPVDAARPAAAALRRAAPGSGAAQWWLPAGPQAHVFDTSRWVRVAVHTLPGQVRQLQSIGGVVWALVGEPEAATLWRQDDATAGGWQRLSGAGEPMVAWRASPQRLHGLALRGEPPALLWLDRHGTVLHSGALPAEQAWQGIAGWHLA
jgi:hypothetical protein